jgi:hypothetical protein
MGCACAGGSSSPSKTQTAAMQISGMGENDLVIHQGVDFKSDAMCPIACSNIIVRCLKLPNEITVEDGNSIKGLLPGDKFMLMGDLDGCVNGWCGDIVSADPATRSIKVSAPFTFISKDTSYAAGGVSGGGALAALAGCAPSNGAAVGTRPQLYILDRKVVTNEGYLVVENGRNDIALKVRSDAAGSDIYLIQPVGVVKVGMTLSVQGMSGTVKEVYPPKAGFDVVRLDKPATEQYDCRLASISATAIPLSFVKDSCGCTHISLSWKDTEKIVAPQIKGCHEAVKVGRYMTYEISGKGTAAETRGGCVQHGCVWVIPGIDSAIANFSTSSGTAVGATC